MRAALSVIALLVLAGQAGRSHAQTPGFAVLHQMLPPDADPANTIALGDVDGDGDLDALVGVAGQNRLYINAGGGRFEDFTANHLPVDSDWTAAIALGDVDGDGDLDALLGNASFQQNRLYLNTGAGIFIDATAAHIPSRADRTWALALGDVDRDGDLDVLIGNASSQSNRLYLNDGAGTFRDASAGNLPPDSDPTCALALGDLDGDGDLDALIGNSGRSNRLYRNDGTGAFRDVTATALPLDSGDTRALALGDVDGDGDLDALAGNWAQRNRLYLNDGAGSFRDATAANLPLGSDVTKALAGGDVDGDGDLDIMIGNEGGQANRLYLNDGRGGFTDATATHLPSDSEESEGLALGDVDGDGDLDAVIANGVFSRRGQNRLYLNHGDGVFADVTALPLPPDGESATAIALGDVDGDGDLDALIGNSPEQDRLLLNDGSASFADITAAALPASQGGTSAARFGDLDGDGDLDALVARDGGIYLFLNGGGVFVDATAMRLPPGAGKAVALALGDLDGDGDLDALIGNAEISGWQNALYLNDGRGHFSDASANLPAQLEQTLALALGDLDGDGDLDALIGNLRQPNRLYRNAGGAVFVDVTATSLPARSDGTRALALGDVDGDGDLDALIGNTGQDRLYINAGGGVFADATAAGLPPDADNTSALILGDVDGDGDLDAAIGHLGRNRLYHNDGTGVFTDVSAAAMPPLVDLTTPMALGDLDGDGDPDLLVGNQGQNRIYANTTRQLAWRAIPRPARPLEMMLAGPAAGGWVLMAAGAVIALPIPPLGVLRLDPASVVIADAGALDGRGRAEAVFAIPADPTLVGADAFWQALVGFPLALTNLETTAFTDL